MTDELESWRELHQRVLEKDRHTPIAIDASWPWPVQLVGEAVNSQASSTEDSQVNTNKPTKFCKDCKWCVDNPTTWDPEYALCSNKRFINRHSVTGRQMYQQARALREEDSECGAKAAYFEAKDD